MSYALHSGKETIPKWLIWDVDHHFFDFVMIWKLNTYVERVYDENSTRNEDSIGAWNWLQQIVSNSKPTEKNVKFKVLHIVLHNGLSWQSDKSHTLSIFARQVLITLLLFPAAQWNILKIHLYEFIHFASLSFKQFQVDKLRGGVSKGSYIRFVLVWHCTVQNK